MHEGTFVHLPSLPQTAGSFEERKLFPIHAKLSTVPSLNKLLTRPTNGAKVGKFPDVSETTEETEGPTTGSWVVTEEEICPNAPLAICNTGSFGSQPTKRKYFIFNLKFQIVLNYDCRMGYCPNVRLVYKNSWWNLYLLIENNWSCRWL